MGILRFTLSMLVLITHTSSPFKFLHISGTEAVICFYVVSGYLISRVLNKIYLANTKSFYINRFLKIFPIYWGSLIFAFICYQVIPTGHHNPLKIFKELNSENNFITVYYTILANFGIVLSDLSRILKINEQSDLLLGTGVNGAFSGAHNLLLIPQAWTLAIEIYFYVVAPFLVKSVQRTVASLLCLFFIETILEKYLNLFQNIDHESLFIYQLKYFLIGALAFHLANRIKFKKTNYFLIFVLICSTFYIANYRENYLLMSIVLALLIPNLALLSESSFSRQIGEYSYPIYLVHYPIAKFIEDKVDSGFQFVLAASLSIAVSGLLIMSIGHRLNSIRDRIRGTNGN